jgi:hypothetical protein
MPLEKSFRKPQRLGPCKEQFLSLLNLLLSLRVEFVHSISLLEKAATHCSRARSHVQSGASTLCRPKASERNFDVVGEEPEIRPQLQP